MPFPSSPSSTLSIPQRLQHRCLGVWPWARKPMNSVRVPGSLGETSGRLVYPRCRQRCTPSRFRLLPLGSASTSSGAAAEPLSRRPEGLGHSASAGALSQVLVSNQRASGRRTTAIEVPNSMSCGHVFALPPRRGSRSRGTFRRALVQVRCFFGAGGPMPAKARDLLNSPR